MKDSYSNDLSCDHVENRVYAKTKKKKTLEELEILPICSKKRVCEKLFWKNFRNSNIANLI